MKLTGINSDPENRVKLDAAIRVPIKHFLDAELVSVDEVVFLLTRMLPELCEASPVLGHVLAAYECARKKRTKPILTVEHIAKLLDAVNYPHNENQRAD